MLRKIGFLALLALGAACAHQSATPQPAERRYTMMLGANRAGTQVTRVEGSRLKIDFEFNDRGRGPKTTTDLLLNDRHLPAQERTTGVDYFKGPVDEIFAQEGTTARWHNKAEDGKRVATDAFYVSMFGPPEETALLANALLSSLNHHLPLLPAGEASIEKVSELSVGGKQIIDYAISTSRFMAIILVAARVRMTAAFQFDFSCQRGGRMKSATPISAANAARWRSVAT